MAFEVNKRIFGSRIPQRIQDKLNQRQNLNAKDKKPGESLLDNYATNTNGIADLSSRTPAARLWTGVQLVQYEYKGEGADKQLDSETPLGTQVYIIGNNIYNNQPVKPNDPIQTPSTTNEYVAKAFPTEFESDKNVFFDAPSGIKTITSQTEGMGAVKKTSVNFRVFNFADYQNIYLKYFLRPGAQMFIDFGWDVASMYDPEELLKDPSQINEKLYGEGGFVTRSEGDLETLTGTVVNYTSKVLEDGSVDISLEIMSSGTALISKDMSKGDAAKVRRRISFGLDLVIMKHLKELGYVEKFANVPTDGRVNTDYEVSQQFSKSATSAGLKTPLSAGMYMDGKDAMTYSKSYDASTAGTYGLDIFNYPSQEAVTAGVFFASNKNLTESNLFISFGLFEDLLLNKEFGFGESFDDVLEGTNALRFDSSNHFMRWSEMLSRRQGKSEDIRKLSYLYPSKWDDTYNTIIGKKPNYPDKDAEYQEVFKNRSKTTIQTINKIAMTQEQKKESILQFEMNKYGYQTITPDWNAAGGYTSPSGTVHSDIAKFFEFDIAPYRTKGEPYCINLGGANDWNTPFGNGYYFSPGRSSGQQTAAPQKNTDCGYHGNQDVNGGWDRFVASVAYEGNDYSNNLQKPLEESISSAYYIATYHGDTFAFTAYTSKVGFKKGDTYMGGNFGYIEEIVEKSFTDKDITTTQLDKELRRIPIRELFVSVATIKKAFINNSKLTDTLKEIYDQIKADSGGILDLHLSSNDYTNTKMSSIDRNWVESETGILNTEYFMFDINNNSTLVKSFDISYEIPSDDYSSVLAIQSMAGKELIPTDTTMDYILSDKLLYTQDESSTFGLKYQPYLGGYQAGKIQSYTTSNQDEYDNPDFKGPFVSDDASDEKASNLYSQLKGGISITNPNSNDGVVVDFNSTPPTPSENPTVTKEEKIKTADNVMSLQNLTDEKIYANNTEDWYLSIAKNNYFYQVSSTLLPFEITLRLYGISSLAVGDTFQVSYLPERYRKMTYFQITGISHNIESTGWTTELTSKMRMKSSVKLDHTLTNNVIVQYGTVPKNVPYTASRKNRRLSTTSVQPIALNPKSNFIFNGHNILNPAIKTIVPGMVDVVPMGIELNNEYQTRFHLPNTLQFTWNPDSSTAYYEDAKAAIAFYDGMWNPIHGISRRNWNRVLKNESLLTLNNPNLAIELFGDKAPPKSKKPYMMDLRQGNSEGWLKGTVNMGRLEKILGSKDALYEKWMNNYKYHRSANISSTKYWVFKYKTTLVPGQKYIMFATYGFSEAGIFPIETDVTALDEIFTAVYPKSGNPLFPYDEYSTTNYYQQYKSYDDILDDGKSNQGGTPGEPYPSSTPQ